MLPCNKRQTIVKRSEGLTILRCMNRQSGVYGQEVNEDICSRCPVRSVHHKRPCKKVGVPPKERTDLPVTENEMVNVSDKEVMEMIKAAGLNTDDIDKSKENAPDYPSLSIQMWNYKEALIRWNKAGRPTRSKEEVAELHKTCQSCDWYDSEKERCKGCGCKVTTGSFAIFNKLKMATEHCPKGEF